MAEEIVQKMGFDAGQAISAIGNLNGSLDTLNKKLRDVTNAAKGFNNQKTSKALDNVSAGANKASSGVDKVDKSAKKAKKSLDAAGKSGASFVLSMQTLSRIALAQTIVRSLNVIKAEFGEAVRTARDFNLTLTSAAAISPGGIANFKNEVTSLNAELREVSRSFGFDVLDLAEAKYRELSNQVKGTADSNKLFITSNKLARISTTTVADSVNAISSVLNSFDKGAEESDRAAAALFKTVELGRVRLNTIANSIGNVTPLARNAGIAFNEVGAALATITRAGVSAPVALTQIRSLIAQLEKPSEALAGLFAEFGVAGIQEAVDKFGGLKGVIEAIAADAQGNSARIAELFTNRRARVGFISLSNQVDQLGSSLEQINEASQNASTFLGELLAEFDDQEAVKFTQVINDLKVAFLELAQEGLPLLTFLLRGAEKAITNLGTTLATVGGLSLAAYGVRLGVATGATNLLTTATLTAKASVFGFGVGLGVTLGELLKLADAKISLSGLNKTLEELGKTSEENIKQIGIDAGVAAKKIQDLAKKSRSTLAVLQAVSKDSQKSILEANNTFVSTLESSLGDLVSNRQRFVKALEASVSGLESRITKRQEESAGIREDIADNEFERRLRGFNDLQQAFQRQKRAEEALRAAANTPSTNKGLEERAKALERVKNFAEDAVNAAQATENRGAIFRAESLLADVLKEQLSTKRLQNQVDEDTAAQAKERLATERANLGKLKDAVKDFQANLSIFTDGGAVFGPEDRAAAEKNAKEALKKIQDLAFDADDLKFGDLLGVVSQQINFGQLLNQVTSEFTGVKDSLTTALERVGKENTLQIPIEFITQEGANLGFDIEIDAADPLTSILQITKDVEASLLSAASKQEEFAQASENAALKQEEIRAKTEEILVASILLSKTPPGILINEESLLSAENLIRKILAKDIIEDDDINKVITLLGALNAVGAIDLPGLLPHQETKFLNDFRKSLEELREERQKAGEGGPNERRLEDLGEFQRLLVDQQRLQEKAFDQQGKISQQIARSKDAQVNLNTEQGNSSTTVGNINTGYQTLKTSIDAATSAQKLLNAAQAASSAQAAAAPTSKMFGGPIFRAFGGFVPRGSDTIPAMLSPGETVINARSSRQFASQISAMNAGVTPAYRAEGGVVNNSVNVGDINVNGTASPDATARSVVSQIRREFRRGTSSKFR